MLVVLSLRLARRRSIGLWFLLEGALGLLDDLE